MESQPLLQPHSQLGKCGCFTKLQQKISGTWRTLQGLADFAALRSYLSTATKHGADLLDVLQQLFTTGPWLPPDSVAVSS